MRILVVSDTHKNLNRFWDVFEKLKRENPVQMIVHCGDYYEDASAIRMRAGVPVTAVRGNCDGDFSGESYVILETEAGDFFVTHGHMENVGHDLQKLCYKAEEAGCIGAIFGHTYRSAYVFAEDMYLMNPGSLQRPRDGSGGTFGILETGQGSVFGKIYRYEDFMSDEGSGGPGGSGGSVKKAQKPASGRLSRMLNYSDRF